MNSAADDIDRLIKSLGDADATVRQGAADALVAIGLPAVDALCAALGERDWVVRETAAEALGKLGDARAVAPLCRALRDEVASVCVRATDALVALGSHSLRALCGALGDEDWAVRTQAALALGRLGDLRAGESLCRALCDAKEDVRVRAADALGRLGDWRAADTLCMSLGERAGEVSIRAAHALVAIGRPGVEPLCRALKAGTKEARKRAEDALARIGSRDDLPRLVLVAERMPLDRRLGALHALHAVGRCPPVADLLERLVTDTDPAVAEAARQSLAARALLRPSTSPGSDAAVLLRPASGEGDPSTDGLVRPSEEPAPAPPRGRWRRRRGAG